MCAVSMVLIVAGALIPNLIPRIVLLVLGVFLLLFTMNFFRDPDRNTPSRENIVISPADGKVILVKKVTGHHFVNGEACQISIFMSPLNVHVNRIPISGTVAYCKHIAGKFIAAFEDKASEENERCETGITSAKGNVFFTQVAGYVARRIVNPLKKGDAVTIGERFGMIKFGSRVDIILPAHWAVLVKKGDVVFAGETVLCEIK